MSKTTVITLVLAGLALPSAAIAAGDPPPGKPPRDPNEVVCEKQEVLGSRLNTKRVCMTRAQWQEQRMQDRMDLDRSQNARPLKGE